MRRPMQATSSAMLLCALALALAACSGSSTPKAVAITFKSPVVVDNTLPSHYTCDGADVSPPLEWGKVPAGTKELALFMLALTPIHGTGQYSTSVVWGLAGVNPSLHRIAAGELPPGAHLAYAANGKQTRYSVCPARGQKRAYQFALYVIPSSITVPARFVGIKLLEVIANPESKYNNNVGGAFAATYERAVHRGAQTKG
ncbi:MAG TPA: hypothetical protein VK691_04445 [Solirubrobacteraceae bacterium]|jgi:phosphatidylethanolamine-binding protein (PEBP) family uncharacterized protein|nr:hypothetical protein [Solirubrobacteraceae bacterium]